MAIEGQEIKSEITQIVVAAWTIDRRPLLLSRLGSLLSEAARAQFRTSNLTLKEYLLRNLADAVRVVSVPEKGDAAAPNESAMAAPISPEITQLVQNRLSPIRFPRYQPDVWAAFSRPLPQPPLHRYLQMTGSRALLHALATDHPPDDTFKEILPSDFPAMDDRLGYPAAPDVAEAIARWAERHGIGVEKLQAGASPSLNEQRATNLEHADKGVNGIDTASSRLVKFLEVIPPHDLPKIIIPSDVLLTILKRG